MQEKISYDKLCYTLAKLDTEKQTEFFKCLESTITEQEKECLMFGISYFRTLINPELNNAIKSTLATALYQTFREEQKK